MTPQPKPPLLLLGSGYTGHFLMAEASGQGRSAVATSRDQDRHLADISPTQRLRFDLAQPDTWKNIPVGADIIGCFPAAPLEHVQACAGTLSASSRVVLVFHAVLVVSRACLARLTLTRMSLAGLVHTKDFGKAL